MVFVLFVYFYFYLFKFGWLHFAIGINLKYIFRNKGTALFMNLVRSRFPGERGPFYGNGRYLFISYKVFLVNKEDRMQNYLYLAHAIREMSN